MYIREASVNDINQLRDLYFGTITTVNIKDYDTEQITAWAYTASRIESLIKKIKEQHFYVAEASNLITGFASLENSGHLDMMYVHKDFQHKKIATPLLKRILDKAKSLGLSSIDTDASKTAKPFFEKHGFELVQEQTVYINNIGLTNYKMILRGIQDHKAI